MTISETARIRFKNRDDMFGASSRAFLASVPRHQGLVVDVGCAIGYTTRMLAEALEPARTVGLDTNPSFVEVARISAPAGVEFTVHDATEVPFPSGLADVVYSRFVLPHVEEPLAVLERWATQLRPGGRLLLEEVEAIRGDEDDEGAVRRYLDLTAAIAEHHGGAPPEVGLLLGATAWTGPLRCVASRRASVRPAASVLLPPFLLNLRHWRRDAFVRETYPEVVLRDLEEELGSLARAGAPGAVTWEVRQIVLEPGSST